MDDLAVFEHHDSVGPDGHGRLMGNQQNGSALLFGKLMQEQAQVLAGHRIEVAGRFVGQEDGRFTDKRPSDGHPLLFAAA